jgi:hypothetical protein
MDNLINPSSRSDPPSSSNARPALMPDGADDILTHHLAGIRQMEKAGYALGVRRGRITLFLIAALMFASEVLIDYAKDLLSWKIFMATLIEASLFIAIGLYTYKKPYIAIISGLVLYIGLWVIGLLLSFFDPGSLYSLRNMSSIAVRLVIIVFLLWSLPDARKLEHMEKEN